MQGWDDKEKKKDWKYISIYYDIETTQHEPIQGKPGTFEHKPNLLISQAICDECKDVNQNDYFCTICKNRQHVFHNLDDPNLSVIGQFIDYLKSFPKKTALLIIAHNAKAFDGHCNSGCGQ
jgi:hypothetical protein